MIDMEANADMESGDGETATASGMPPFIDRIIQWYIRKKQK